MRRSNRINFLDPFAMAQIPVRFAVHILARVPLGTVLTRVPTTLDIAEQLDA